MRRATQRFGFTIVELLIVVVVIAILAAIIIVAYNGIQTNAKRSASQSVAAQAAHKIASYAVLNADTYPSDITVSDINLVSNDKTAYQYWTSTDLKSYCLTSTTNNISYYVSNANPTPNLGACAGHGANGAVVITNQALNPSFENDTGNVTYMGGAGTDSNVARSIAWANSGAQSIQVTKIVSSGAPKGVKVTIPQALNVGDVVRWAAVVRNSGTNTNARSFLAYGERGLPTYVAYNYGGTTQTVNPGQDVRIVGQITVDSSRTASAGTAGFGILPQSTTPFAVNESYFIDSIIITVNQDLPSGYADGSTSGWAWTGTPGASTSTGPTF